uniref:Ig-like domain-containing protein n=1 Tax=Macrostomum lignano TaxID=282301 RepID=A0A1I8GUB9_9PLAT
MLNTEKASANVDLIRVKATQLKRLLSAAESAAEYENLHQISAAETQTRQLRTQLDAYFDETLRRFERRRTELKAALDRRLAAAAAANTGKEQTLLTEAAEAASAVCSEAASVDLLRRLDDAIALREQPGIDLAEAERRTRRLLSCLRLNSSCHDDGDGEDADWVRQRRADNPFAAGASSATVSEPPTTESAYGEFASSGSIDFSHVLTPSNSLKACDATGSQSPSAETPNPYRLDHTPTHSGSVSAIDMFPPLSATQPLSIQPAGANGLSYLQHDASFDADDRPPSISDSPSSDSSDTSSFREIKDCRTVGAPKSVTYVHDKFYTVEGGCIRQYRCQDGRCLGKLALTDDECNPVDYRPLYVRRCTKTIGTDFKIQPMAVSNGSHLFICCPEQAIFIWLLTLRLQLRVHPMQQSNVEQQQQLRLLRARLGGFFEETVSELERRQSELYASLAKQFLLHLNRPVHRESAWTCQKLVGASAIFWIVCGLTGHLTLWYRKTLSSLQDLLTTILFIQLLVAQVDHDAKLYVQQFRTMNSPYSIASIHGKFYTVEKNSVHRYDAVSGKYRGQLRVTDFDGVEMQHTKAYRLSSCKTNDWLITVDKRNDMVLCVDSKHRCELEIGPKVSARYFLENPEQAVSNGSCLFICCPLVGIFILVVDSAYSAVRVVTQTCEYLDLEQPVRMAWCESAGHLVVVDDEDGRYVARAFEFANCHKPSGGLMLNSEFYACLASDRTPEIAYLPSGGSGFSPLAVIVDGYELMQFRDESFRRLDRNPLRRLNYTCEFGNWERLTDVCWVDDPVGDGGSRLAVCDKRGCRVSLLRLEP